jgi:hypothetical protein
MMEIIYRIHAIQRMFERSVSAEDMRFVLQRGKAIETYEDAHYPGRLLLGGRGRRPLHVVVADNVEDDQAIVVTAYEPDGRYWEPGFQRRRR